MAWSVTLPVWIALAVGALFVAPAAAYLWTVPLLAAGLLLSAAPPTNGTAIRAVSLLVFAVVATIWLNNAIELLRFIVATLGRLPIVTPVFVYPAVMLLAGLVLVPPLAGTVTASRRLLRPSLFTALALIAVVATAGTAYRAPAYTRDAPQRRVVRALQTGTEAATTWEVGSTEPGLDLSTDAPAGWTLVSTAPTGGVPWGRLAYPFVFRTTTPSIGPAPVEIAQATLLPVAGGLELSVAVVPREPGLTVSFVLPAGVTPARHNLPGVVRLGSWTATYVAIPADGVSFRASFNTTDPARVGRPICWCRPGGCRGARAGSRCRRGSRRSAPCGPPPATWALPVPIAATEPLR